MEAVPSRPIVATTRQPTRIRSVSKAMAVLTSLDAAPRLISADDTPIPYSGPLEDAWAPSVDRITAELRRLAAE